MYLDFTTYLQYLKKRNTAIIFFPQNLFANPSFLIPNTTIASNVPGTICSAGKSCHNCLYTIEKFLIMFANSSAKSYATQPRTAVIRRFWPHFLPPLCYVTQLIWAWALRPEPNNSCWKTKRPDLFTIFW